ncbi:MAG: hypothetical protein ACRD1T_22040 [Acidimicrobiia bacterium]
MQTRCTKKGVDSSGVHYLSCSGTLYLSLNYHRGSGKGRPGKSLWAIARNDECHTFSEAEIGKWSDEQGDYWAVSLDAKVELGKNGERLAFFDAPINIVDPWHGYPVSGRRGSPIHRRPPDALVGRWLKELRGIG